MYENGRDFKFAYSYGALKKQYSLHDGKYNRTSVNGARLDL